MKTKKVIKLTPFFSSVFQSIMIILVILLVITIKERWPIIIAAPLACIALYLIATGLSLDDDSYYESIYGICRYRIIKTEPSDSDWYFIQAKPLLPFFFLPWKGAACVSFLYQSNGKQYMCSNAFKTKEDAYNHVKELKNRYEYKKLFFIKKIEICN